MESPPRDAFVPPRDFVAHELAAGFCLYTGRLPEELRPGLAAFEVLWGMRPPHVAEVVVDGPAKPVPRWHQAYGHDYQFAEYSNRALPVPTALFGLLAWAQGAVDARLNGILVNWYDAQFEHRIGQHKDSPVGRIVDSPIVTISLGAARTFRMLVSRRWIEFRVGAGDVVVLPEATNRQFAHAVPHLPGDEGRRISVTIRAFVAANDADAQTALPKPAQEGDR